MPSSSSRVATTAASLQCPSVMSMIQCDDVCNINWHWFRVTTALRALGSCSVGVVPASSFGLVGFKGLSASLPVSSGDEKRSPLFCDSQSACGCRIFKRQPYRCAVQSAKRAAHGTGL